MEGTKHPKLCGGNRSRRTSLSHQEEPQALIKAGLLILRVGFKAADPGERGRERERGRENRPRPWWQP